MTIENIEKERMIKVMTKKALDMAIKALEQQPSEDCISRADVLALAEKGTLVSNGAYKSVCKAINELPSVTPKYTDEEIDKAQLVEQAYVDKMVELAVKELKTPKAEWTPVSERLPEEFVCDDGYVEPSDYVLVWGDHGNYGVSRYWGNRKSKIENPNSYKDWMDLDWVVQKPIAWCELPEPYKTESEVQE